MTKKRNSLYISFHEVHEGFCKPSLKAAAHNDNRCGVELVLRRRRAQTRCQTTSFELQKSRQGKKIFEQTQIITDHFKPQLKMLKKTRWVKNLRKLCCTTKDWGTPKKSHLHNLRVQAQTH